MPEYDVVLEECLATEVRIDAKNASDAKKKAEALAESDENVDILGDTGWQAVRAIHVEEE